MSPSLSWGVSASSGEKSTALLGASLTRFDFRFYEEGDAASMVIPRESDFRKNIDWLDNNFPREVGCFFTVTSLFFLLSYILS